jgi:deoxyribodipyrimidine photo-lyase
MPAAAVPPLRIRVCHAAPARADGAFVLYWMIAHRRVGWNFALDRALEWARELARPLLVLEALRADYPWASVRLHRFVLDGMADTWARLRATPVAYYPYVEPAPGAGKGLLAALGARAAVCVTDDFPAFGLPRMVAAAGRQLPVRLEAVDSNGLLPLRAADRAFPTAYGFRRFLQRTLRDHLGRAPRPDPLRAAGLPALPRLPAEITRRWPPAPAPLLAGEPGALAALPVDRTVGPAPTRGGTTAGRVALERFLAERLARYPEDRNHPDVEGGSGLSPYLHFGHVSAHEVFAAVARREGRRPADLGPSARGSRSGFFRMSAPAEAFLDQLVTWRELGLNTCVHLDRPDHFDSLPAWARRTLTAHARDPRPVRYTLPELEAAATHDVLWNAGQRQLVREGRLHNYVRMLWGKKILEWSPTPEEALAAMLQLNDRYALDGRDPNSLTGIFWVLGRHDRPWGPERPIFGTVRYMSSASAARKLRLREYLRRYAP